MPFNFMIRWILRSPFHFLMSGNTLLLEYTGKKSGKRYQVPVNYVKIDYRFVATSKRERVWWRNFREAQSVKVLIRGKSCNAQAHSIEDKEGVLAGFQEYFAAKPEWAKPYGVQLDEEVANEDDLSSLVENAVLIMIQLDE